MIALITCGLGFGARLVWADEFNAPGKPDPSKWIYEIGFIRNKEPQLYCEENVSVKDGFLVIEGRKEQKPNLNYDPTAPKDDWRKSWKMGEFTSGSIKTATKHTWTYGKFECRGKFGIESGLWPAFWMTGPTRAWPANGEIDIMEFYQGKYHANLAWGSKTPGVGKWNAKATPIEEVAKLSGFPNAQAWAKEFHTYRLEWSKEVIAIYVDEMLLNFVDLSTTVNESPDGKNPFHEPHHLILNLAIGATGGDPSKLTWPQKFVVDWVRVYQ